MNNTNSRLELDGIVNVVDVVNAHEFLSCDRMYRDSLLPIKEILSKFIVHAEVKLEFNIFFAALNDKLGEFTWDGQ